jgi:hypothetical protein
LIVDSYRFLPRSFRPMYEGRGPFPGEVAPVWAPFEKRLAAARIALLTSAGMYVESSQASFDLEREQSHPEWGDPSWRSIPATADAADIGVAHLHINSADIKADPEIALPARLLHQLVVDGVVGGATANHISVMGYQDRSLEGWRHETLPELVAMLRDQQADGLILAPA